MKWLDEAAAIYAACQLRTTRLVTKCVSSLTFDNPAYQGDIVEFYCETERVGKTSFTVKVRARTKELGCAAARNIVTAKIIFVSIGEDGKPVPHVLGLM